MLRAIGETLDRLQHLDDRTGEEVGDDALGGGTVSPDITQSAKHDDDPASRGVGDTRQRIIDYYNCGALDQSFIVNRTPKVTSVRVCV